MLRKAIGTAMVSTMPVSGRLRQKIVAVAVNSYNSIKSLVMPVQTKALSEIVNASYQDDDAEPTLSEVMSDPIIRLLMQRDGVTPLHIWTLVAKVQALRSRQSQSSRVTYEPL